MNPKITYAPEWIEKILSGQKTMTIRRTQYLCGVYDVVAESEPNRVVCRIEVVKVEKVNMPKSLFLNTIDADEYARKLLPFVNFALWSGFKGSWFIEDFIQYHRENYAPVKFAHTFELLKGDQSL